MPMTSPITAGAPAQTLSTLSPHLAYHADETFLSYVARLAWFHTGKGIHSFAPDLGLKLISVLRYREDAIKVIAAVSGTHFEKLRPGLFRPSRTTTSFQGSDFLSAELRPSVSRICPQCLLDDGSPTEWRHRTIWCFAASQTCLIHRRTLVPLPEAGHDLRELVRQSDLEEMARSTAAKDPSALELWLAGRVHRQSDTEPAWIASQSMPQILQASLMLGALLVHGTEVKVTRLSHQEKHESREVGFSVLSMGEDAIMQTLDEVRTKGGKKAPHAGPLAYYGEFYVWLSRRVEVNDPGPIRDLLREHILRTTEVGLGEVILGQTITERRFHSVISLSKVTGIDRRRVSRLLEKLGLLPGGMTDAESGILLFDAEETERIVRAYETAIPLKEVPLYLGASQYQVEMLRKIGILKPLFPPTYRGSIRKIVFARAELDELLEEWRQFDVVAPTDRPHMRSVAIACQKFGTCTLDMLSAIAAGDIKAFREEGLSGLNALRIRTDHIPGWALAA